MQETEKPPIAKVEAVTAQRQLGQPQQRSAFQYHNASDEDEEEYESEVDESSFVRDEEPEWEPNQTAATNVENIIDCFIAHHIDRIIAEQHNQKNTGVRLSGNSYTF